MTVRDHIGLVAIVILSAVGGSVLAQQPPAAEAEGSPAPRMELSSTKFDFGEVWQDMPARKEFTVKNSGDADLTLTLRSTCGCAVVTSPKSPLPPGETTSFTITFDSKALGETNKKVTVTTNDPGQPNVDIAVVGKVKPVFARSPADQIVLAGLATDSSERGVLRLENKYDRPLPLKLKEGQDFAPFDVTLNELKAGLEYELVAVTRPPLSVGTSHVPVVLETGVPEVPTITVAVVANAQLRVIAFPPVLSVTPESKSPVARIVSVDYRKETPVKITAVKPSLAAIEYELLPEEPEGSESPTRKTASLKLRLTIPAYDDVPDDGATVEIFTDDQDPRYQRLEVRIIKLSESSKPRRILPERDSRTGAEKPAERPGAGTP